MVNMGNPFAKTGWTFTVQELITIGTLNALALFIYAAVYLVLHLLPGILAVFKDAVASLFIGGIYICMAVKVPKPPLFTINGILVGLVWSLIGYPILVLAGAAVGGAAADIIAWFWGKYRQKWGLWVAFVFFRLGVVCGLCVPFFLWSDEMARRLVEFGMANPDYASTFAGYFTSQVAAYMLIANVGGALLGAILGTRMIEKYLVKSGVL